MSEHLKDALGQALGIAPGSVANPVSQALLVMRSDQVREFC
jgi:hypothetical protein